MLKLDTANAEKGQFLLAGKAGPVIILADLLGECAFRRTLMRVRFCRDFVSVYIQAILAILLFCVVVVLSSPAQVFTTLVNFDSAHGAGPDAGLAQGRNGNLYGTASSGGTNGNGVVFEMTAEGKLTVLHDFDRTDGDYPQAPLLLSTDGSFYGTTYDGGSGYESYGTIFKISGGGKFKSLFSFDSDTGNYPTAGLIQGVGEDYYGTTYGGFGTVFTMNAKGRVETLYGLGDEFVDPFAGLVMGNDGNFYGTGYVAGANADGEVFQIAPSGAFTVLHSFDQSDGRWPTATLVIGTDGSFYGTTSSGGAYNLGTFYKIDSTGTFAMIHSFASADGEYPQGSLVLGSNGNFYGTTVSGGANMDGTVFEITPSGMLTVLHNFNGTDGASTTAGLLQHTDGTFYGATYKGGTEGYGTVFSLDIGLPPFVSFLPVPGFAGETVGIFGQGLKKTTSVAFNGTPAQFKVVSNSYLKAVVPQDATTGLVTVTMPSETLSSILPFQVW